MAKPAKTFPTFTKAERGNFDLILQAEFGVKILRPALCDAFLGGLNNLPIVPSGKVANSAWRTLHVAECFVYADESTRKRAAGGSQVETVRAAIKKIAGAYEMVSGNPFPIDAVKLTGGEGGNVEVWRIR